jgi:hypothetical protein
MLTALAETPPASAGHRGSNLIGDGIGIALSSEHTITLNGTDFYLVALDFDNCEANRNAEMRGVKIYWQNGGKVRR